MTDEKRPIGVEDLLRLKRLEKPPAEFWVEFDRELRAKQLAALVSKRPWWSAGTSILARLRWVPIPLGAAAVAAVAFVSLREIEEPVTAAPSASVAASVESPATTVSPVALVEEPRALSISPASYGDVEGSEAPELVAVADVVESASSREPEVRTRLVTLASQELGTARSAAAGPSLISLLAGDEFHLGASEISPSARSIASNLAAAQELGAGLLRVSHGFESRAMPARTTKTDPLQQMSSPSDARRARFLTAMVSPVSSESIERTSARMAHRISGEELYEQEQRFGTRRGGFNVKF